MAEPLASAAPPAQQPTAEPPQPLQSAHAIISSPVESAPHATPPAATAAAASPAVAASPAAATPPSLPLPAAAMAAAPLAAAASSPLAQFASFHPVPTPQAAPASATTPLQLSPPFAQPSATNSPALRPAATPPPHVDIKLETPPEGSSRSRGAVAPAATPVSPPTSLAPPAISRAMRLSVPVRNSDGSITQCPCGDNEDQVGFMIQCEKCEIWQHGGCIGLSEKTVPEEYYCETCDVAHAIHVAFRRRWGEGLPVKGKGKSKAKAKQAMKEGDASAGGAREGAAGAPATGERRNPQRQSESAANAAPAGTPVGHKRKRTAEETTPKPPCTAKKGETQGLDASVNSPDLQKRPRLEDAAATHAAQQAAADNARMPSAAPSLPKQPSYTTASSTGAATLSMASEARRAEEHARRREQFDASSASMPPPHNNNAASAAASTAELEQLAADLHAAQQSGGELTPQGSREAKKIQRYIQMIQKMEDKTKQSGTAAATPGQSASTKTEGGVGTAGQSSAPMLSEADQAEEREDAEMQAADEAAHALEQQAAAAAGGRDANGQPLEPIPLALSNVYGSSAEARMARAKLRAEKLVRAESTVATDATAAPAAGEGSAEDKTQSAADRKKVARQKKKEEEVPALTAAEIRQLRLTASSQLRPLGPMYFGRKQYLLSSYRDERLRCETGWAHALHQELPVPKRVVANHRLTESEGRGPHAPLAHHHHHPGHPPSIFPASHPWSIAHIKVSKASRPHAAAHTEADAAAAAASAASSAAAQDSSAAVTKMDLDGAADDDAAAAEQPEQPKPVGAADDAVAEGVATAAEAADADAEAHTPGGEPSVKHEGGAADEAAAASLPPPESFFASIDTAALPDKIRALISSFSSGARSQSPPAAAAAPVDAPDVASPAAPEPVPVPAVADPVAMEEDAPDAAAAAVAPVPDSAPDAVVKLETLPLALEPIVKEETQTEAAKDPTPVELPPAAELQPPPSRAGTDEDAAMPDADVPVAVDELPQ